MTQPQPASPEEIEAIKAKLWHNFLEGRVNHHAINIASWGEIAIKTCILAHIVLFVVGMILLAPLSRGRDDLWVVTIVGLILVVGVLGFFATSAIHRHMTKKHQERIKKVRPAVYAYFREESPE